MRLLFFAIFLYLHYGESRLWNKGVVHYAINKKDYDPHSQDIIASTFKQIEREICVKFFNTPLNYSVSNEEKILYVANPDKKKSCPPEHYNYEGSVVDMPIGYKCLNAQDISRIVMDMLRASIEEPVQANSNDLLRKFQERTQNDDTNSAGILSAFDRNFINAYYHVECNNLIQIPVETRRSNGGTLEVTADNERFYKDKLWPLGIVMYGAETRAQHSTDFAILQHAMTIIELSSCVVFRHITEDEPLQPKNLLWFSLDGEEVPHLGFMEGNQSLHLPAMVNGAPGHNAHTLNLLMRILGLPMMSNRYDRDNYVTINWKNVAKTKEHYLERVSKDSWLKNMEGEGAAYDYESVTHAPANFMCGDCSLGEQTVQPLQDHLWQRTLTMGHRTDLSASDIEMLALLYTKQCQHRFMNNS